MSRLDEDNLAQKTTAEYLRDNLGWELVYAFNNETFGPNGTLGRQTDREIILTRYLDRSLRKINPGHPESAYEDAIRLIKETPASQNVPAVNRDKHELYINGVQVSYRNNKGELVSPRLRIFDFDNPENNHFLSVRELWIRGTPFRKRADLVCFVNGIPLIFIELKNIHKDLRRAYEENIYTYLKTIPEIFYHNAFIVLGNGSQGKLGSITNKYEHFHEWKRLHEEEAGIVDLETLLKGVCNKRTFLDIFENFILFDQSSGKLSKIVGRNHQVLGVNRSFEAVIHRKERNGKLGVFWHTQGSGKSYSMVFFARKIHRKLGGNYTFLICTDRDDLDNQIYKTFAGCGIADHEKRHCRASSGRDLKQLLQSHTPFIFTLIQKFNEDVGAGKTYTERDDLIVISDEAHRTQYGTLALNMRNAIPNASYIGFTGTPLFKNDEITKQVFGDYISTYDFQRAIEDGATLPLFFDARGEKLGLSTSELNQRVADKIEEFEIDDIDTSEKLERELQRDYHIITAEKRLRQIAEDFVEHYSTRWDSGKAMFVCIDKITCVRMHNFINEYWLKKIAELEKGLKKIYDEQEYLHQERQIQWMKETLMAVIVSEEQGEVAKFDKWGLDILSHRKLIKEGFQIPSGRIDLETAFKKEDHPFRVAIVCAMWLTGFDVPSLSMLYLDKPLKAHTLMQAIARANRVNEGKTNGLIIDYGNLIKDLRKALAVFAGHQGEGLIDDGKKQPEIDPVRPESELLDDLKEIIEAVRHHLEIQGFRLDDLLEKKGFERNKTIDDAKEAINENDYSRKRFEIIARDLFRKFKACITIRGINKYRPIYEAINIVYKNLQSDRDKADISLIIRELHRVVDEVVHVLQVREETVPYDISRIDFERLRVEFQKCQKKKTTVQNLKTAIENKLQRMIKENPMRADLQQHYEDIIERYNRGKDRLTIEQTFEELIRFVNELDEEEHRAMREGLDEETLALYDILRKEGLAKDDIAKVKQISKELLNKLKAEKLRFDSWHVKEATRDAVRIEIKNFLWDDILGLPTSYSETEVHDKSEAVYTHIYQQYAFLYQAPSKPYSQRI